MRYCSRQASCQPAPLQQHAGEVQVEAGQGGLVVLLGGQWQGLLHQLQGADAVALHGADVAAAAAMVAAIELAGDDVAVMLDLIAGIALGRRFQQPPVALVDVDDGLAEIVDLIDAAQALQAGDGGRQVLADLRRIVLGVERQLAQAIVGVLEIAGVEGLHERIARRRRGAICGDQPDGS